MLRCMTLSAHQNPTARRIVRIPSSAMSPTTTHRRTKYPVRPSGARRNRTVLRDFSTATDERRNVTRRSWALMAANLCAAVGVGFAVAAMWARTGAIGGSTIYTVVAAGLFVPPLVVWVKDA